MSAVNNVWAWGFPAGSVVKNPPVSAGDPDSIPESGRCPGEGMATHSRILAWRISWTEELGRLQSTGSQRVWQDWRNKQQHVGNERCMNTSLFNAVLSKRDPTPFGYLYIFILVFFPPPMGSMRLYLLFRRSDYFFFLWPCFLSAVCSLSQMACFNRSLHVTGIFRNVKCEHSLSSL